MEMAKEFEGKAKFTKVDCSVNKRVAMGFRVMGLPTFLFWKDGVEVRRLTKEECTPETIRAEIEKLIA
jgi:thioredoxin 1